MLGGAIAIGAIEITPDETAACAAEVETKTPAEAGMPTSTEPSTFLLVWDWGSLDFLVIWLSPF